MPTTRPVRLSDDRIRAQAEATGLLADCATIKSDLGGWSELGLKAARRIIDIAPRYGIIVDPTEFGLVVGVRTAEVSSEAVTDQLDEIIRTTKTASLIVCRACGRDLPIERMADFAARCIPCEEAWRADTANAGTAHSASRFTMFRKRQQ